MNILTDTEVRTRAAQCASHDLCFITLKPLDHSVEVVDAEKGITRDRMGLVMHDVAGLVFINKNS